MIEEGNFIFDSIEKIGNSLIQHGLSNQRIYLIKYDPQDRLILFDKFKELVRLYNYSKIFVKIPQNEKAFFLSQGFEVEGFVPDFWKDQTCFFMSRFLTEERRVIKVPEMDKIEEVLKISQSKSASFVNFILPLEGKYQIKIITEEHLFSLANLYQATFISYPFPIFDENYLRQTKNDSVIYFGVFTQDDLVAASSVEIDYDSQSGEMTDFAVKPEHRGQKLALFLLKRMEEEVRNFGIRTAYTIARSLSFAMNSTYSRAGYSYGGRLVNNTNIAGKIESMNVWHKKLEL